MNKKQIDIKLREILCELSRVECDITPNTSIINDLDFDSVETMEMLVRIEDEFNIEFSDEDLTLSNFDRYCDLVEYIERSVSNNF